MNDIQSIDKRPIFFAGVLCLFMVPVVGTNTTGTPVWNILFMIAVSLLYILGWLVVRRAVTRSSEVKP